jgi:hypothetical protein
MTTLSRRAMLRSMITWPLIAASASGCKLLFEPPEDALDRFLQAIAMGEDSTFESMLEGAEEFDRVKNQAIQLKTSFRSPLYRGRTNYWAIAFVEEDAANDWTIFEVTFQIPRPNVPTKRGSLRSSQPDEESALFYLRRSYLQWHVIDIDDAQITTVLNVIAKNRGI